MIPPTRRSLSSELTLFFAGLQNNAGCFSPTRLATTLTSSAPPLPTGRSTGGGAQGEGFIVLETNYRLYAYTGASIYDLYVYDLLTICRQSSADRRSQSLRHPQVSLCESRRGVIDTRKCTEGLD